MQRALSTRIGKRLNYVKEKNGEYDTLLLGRNDISRGQENTWYFDTGASNHINGNKSMFVELNESVNDNVVFKSDSKVQVKGKGNILFRAKDDSYKIISNVYYVANIKSNILGLGQLLKKTMIFDKKSYQATFKFKSRLLRQ